MQEKIHFPFGLSTVGISLKRTIWPQNVGINVPLHCRMSYSASRIVLTVVMLQLLHVWPFVCLSVLPKPKKGNSKMQILFQMPNYLCRSSCLRLNIQKKKRNTEKQAEYFKQYLQVWKYHKFFKFLLPMIFWHFTLRRLTKFATKVKRQSKN